MLFFLLAPALSQVSRTAVVLGSAKRRFGPAAKTYIEFRRLAGVLPKASAACLPARKDPNATLAAAGERRRRGDSSRGEKNTNRDAK